MEKSVIGLIEKVKIFGKKGKKEVEAKIDTGATRSSIDEKLADELRLGPIITTKVIKNVHGNSVRPVVNVKLELDDRIIEEQFTLADRRNMKYPVLIGQNILTKGFLIDPSKKLT